MSTNDLIAGYTRYTTTDEIGMAADSAMGLVWPTTTVLTGPTTVTTLPVGISITPIG